MNPQIQFFSSDDMNNRQPPLSELTHTAESVKKELLKLYQNDDFTVAFSEDVPKRTLGDYRYHENHITIYYKHMTNDNDLMLTAIHELAHHKDYIDNGKRPKPHLGPFKDILGRFEQMATELGIIKPISTPELEAVYQKALELGELLTKFADVEGVADHTKALVDKLHGINKTALFHLIKLYNSDKKGII